MHSFTGLDNFSDVIDSPSKYIRITLIICILLASPLVLFQAETLMGKCGCLAKSALYYQAQALRSLFFYKGRNGKTFGWGANKSFLVSLIRQRWSIFCTKCIKKEGSFPPLWPATEVEEPLTIVNLGLLKGQRSPKEYHIICHTILVDLDV